MASIPCEGSKGGIKKEVSTQFFLFYYFYFYLLTPSPLLHTLSPPFLLNRLFKTSGTGQNTVSMEGDEDIRGGTMEELTVGLAVGGFGFCAQRVMETAYVQGAEAVMSVDGFGGFEHHGDQGNAGGYADFLSSSPINGELAVGLLVGDDGSCAQRGDHGNTSGAADILFSSVINNIRVNSIDTNDSLSFCSEETRSNPEETRPPPKKIPKTKKKFGRGVVRGGNKKQGREGSQAITSVACGLIARPSIKHITKAQLSKSLVASEMRTVPLFFNL